MELTDEIIIELKKSYKEKIKATEGTPKQEYWQGRYDSIFDIHERFEW